VDWLTSLPVAVLVVGWLAFALLVALGARVAVRALVPAGEHDQVTGVAAPLMPALGAAFGVLIALTLVGEAGHLKSAQDVVADEAAGASRLAWAATSPGVGTAPIHDALADYLRTTRATEWRDDRAADGDPAVAEALSTLEQAVRAEAVRPELGTPASTELLASLDSLTGSRRQRIAAASRHVPALFVVTLVVGGAALVANAGALAFRNSLRASLLIGGLAAVVGLSLALLFSLSAPWRGSLVVSGHPLDAVAHDLDTGYFR
jgi:hypothetical protein